jgi:hypothetical protein
LTRLWLSGIALTRLRLSGIALTRLRLSGIALTGIPLTGIPLARLGLVGIALAATTGIVTHWYVLSIEGGATRGTPRVREATKLIPDSFRNDPI